METNTNPTHLYDCIVIGGGISGVSFAYKLRERGDNVLLLEKEQRLGGQVQTHLSSHDPQFWSELGAHTCYNSYTRLLSMVMDLHIEQYVRPLAGYKYMLYANGKISSPMSRVSVPSLMMHGPRMLFASKRGKTVRDYFRPIVGSKNYDGLFSNMFRAVICQRADDYPAELFLKGRKERLKQFPRKFTFQQGLSSLLEHIAQASGFNHLRDEEVSEVQYADQTYSVTTRKGNCFLGKRLAFATSPHVASRLLQEIEPEMAELLDTIPMVESGTMNVVVRKDHLPLERVAGIIPVTDDFFSAVSADGIDHPGLRGFSFHYGKHQQDREHISGLVCKVLGIRQEDIVETKFTSHLLPSLGLQHRGMAQQIENVRSNDSVFMLGNYFHGLSLEDCVHRSFDEYARLSEQ